MKQTSTPPKKPAFTVPRWNIYNKKTGQFAKVGARDEAGALAYMAAEGHAWAIEDCQFSEDGRTSHVGLIWGQFKVETVKVFIPAKGAKNE